MMGDNTYCIGQRQNNLLDEWSSVSASLKDLRYKFEELGIPVHINPQEFTATLFACNETRNEILTNIMKKIHPDDSFWVSKSEGATHEKCLQVSKWFGLATEASIVNGFGSYDDQLNFWIKVISIVNDLTKATTETLNCSDLDLSFAKIVNELTLSGSILNETMDSSNSNQTAQPTHSNFVARDGASEDMKYILDEMIRFGYVELNEMENGLEELKVEASFDNFPTKRVRSSSNRYRDRLGSFLKYSKLNLLTSSKETGKTELQNVFALKSSKKLHDIEINLAKIKDAVHRVNRSEPLMESES